jgi:hypothetical protein
MLSVIMLSFNYAERHCAECHYAEVILLSGTMLRVINYCHFTLHYHAEHHFVTFFCSVIVLSVVLQNVIVMRVAAPKKN